MHSGGDRRTRLPPPTFATAGAAALGAGAASADEHDAGGTRSGPRSALVGTGRIDDPLEDVLEHATVLGDTAMTASQAAEPAS